MTYGRLKQALIRNETVLMHTTFTDTPVQIIEALSFAFGYDNVARASIMWVHPTFEQAQIDCCELSKLFIKSEEN